MRLVYFRVFAFCNGSNSRARTTGKMQSSTRFLALYAVLLLLCIAAEGTRQDADTNACLESGSIVEKRCKESGTGYSSGCCKEIKQFNERGCFCNSVISYVFEDGLPNLEAAVDSCGY